MHRFVDDVDIYFCVISRFDTLLLQLRVVPSGIAFARTLTGIWRKYKRVQHYTQLNFAMEIVTITFFFRLLFIVTALIHRYAYSAGANLAASVRECECKWDWKFSISLRVRFYNRNTRQKPISSNYNNFFLSCVWILFFMQIKYENMMKKLQKMNGYDIWSHNIDENLLEIVIILKEKKKKTNEKFTAARDWAVVLMASTFLWSHFDVDVKANPISTSWFANQVISSENGTSKKELK